MVSRTFVDFLTGLVVKGGVSKPPVNQPQKEATEVTMGGSGTSKKDRRTKNRFAALADDDMAEEEDSGPTQGTGFAVIVMNNPKILEAVQGAAVAAARWQDPKTIKNAIAVLRSIAVRFMTGSETHHNIRDACSASLEAPRWCEPVPRACLQPLVALCQNPPQPPLTGGALATMIGKPFDDFFTPVKVQGRWTLSPFAETVSTALQPMIRGLAKVFTHVCKRGQVTADVVQHVTRFAVLMEACQLLSALKSTTQGHVYELIVTQLDPGLDDKLKRLAIRTFVGKAVDPDPEL